MHDICRRLTSLIALSALLGCGPGEGAPEQPHDRIRFDVVATVGTPALREISGMVMAEGPRFLVHNDDGEPEIFVLDSEAAIAARYRLEGAKNRDWEALSWVPQDGRRLLAIGDIGDNLGRRKSIRIYFVALPRTGATPAPSETPIALSIHHQVELSYPDGARDCEAMAYDPASGYILLLTKRDKPPRLYGVSAREALNSAERELEYLGSAPTFRPPTREDMWRLGKDGAWISQPTGMDINGDGTLAAVITYRSLYLFERSPDESWAAAFNRPPREFLGPQSRDEEAIAFAPGMQALYITSEGHPAPIYRAVLLPPSSE